MKRAILVPATLAPGALDELKSWLAISNSQDDVSLVALLRSSLDLCEAFTGQMPIECTAEEVHAATGGWQTLASRPVQAVTQVEILAADGSRSALAVDAYEIELEADGAARFRLVGASLAGRVAVQFVAGTAAGWESMPEALRHGVVRLAAYNYRQRDDDSGAAPPAAVAALWAPWRRLRLT